MGDFVSGTGAQIVGGAALTASARAFRAFRLAGRYEAEWLNLASGPATKGLTAAKVADIEHFLRSPGIPPLLSLLTTTILASDAAARTVSFRAIR